MNDPTPRFVPATFIAVSAASLVGAVALAVGFWQTTLPVYAPDNPTHVEDAPIGGIFTDAELQELRDRARERAARPAPRPKALAVAPTPQPIETPVAVEVMGQLASMELAAAAPAGPDPAAEKAGRVWYDGASRAREMGRLETAMHMLIRAVDRMPEHTEYWVALAEVQTDLGRSDEAATAWRRAAELRTR